MKTFNEIQAAVCRDLMRHAAMMYRDAISPKFNLDWNHRCKLGVDSLLFAIQQRNEARFWEGEAEREKKDEEKACMAVRQSGSVAANEQQEHSTDAAGTPAEDRVTGRQSSIPRG